MPLRSSRCSSQRRPSVSLALAGVVLLLHMLVLCPIRSAVGQVPFTSWQGAIGELCTPVGWPSVVEYNETLFSIGGCNDASCLNQSSVLCAFTPNSLTSKPKELWHRNGTKRVRMRVAGQHAAVMGSTNELLLIMACTFLVPPRSAGPQWRPSEHELQRYRKVFRINPHTGEVIEVADLELHEARANASCVNSGRFLYVAGGVALPTLDQVNTIDVLMPHVNVVLPNRFTIPTDNGVYRSTNMGMHGFSEGFIIVQSGEPGLTPSTYRFTMFATQIDGGSLAGNPPPTVAYEGDPVLAVSASERMAVSLSSRRAVVSADPYSTITFRALVSSNRPESTWNVVTVSGSASILGSASAMFQLASSHAANFIAYIVGGFGPARDGVGAPIVEIQETNLISTQPCPDFSMTPREVYQNESFELHMTLRAQAGWRIRLSLTRDCAEPLSETVLWAVGTYSVNISATEVSPFAFVCYAAAPIFMSGPEGADVGPLLMFDVTNSLSPITVLPPRLTTPAPPTTTTPPPTTTTTPPPTTTTTPAPNTTTVPATTSTTAPPPTQTTTHAPPTSTPNTTSPPTTNPANRGAPPAAPQIPIVAWAVGASLLVVLLAVVGFMGVAFIRPASAPAQLMRAVKRGCISCCGADEDDTINDINATQLHVLRRIGSGGWGTVYLCERGTSGRRGAEGRKDQLIAVKHISCSRNVARELAMREIRVLQSVQGHPNIVRVFEMLVREEILTGHAARRKTPSGRALPPEGTHAAGDTGATTSSADDDSQSDSELSGHDAVATLHQRPAGTTYGMRTTRRRRDRGADRDLGGGDSDTSSVYAESYRSGDGLDVGDDLTHEDSTSAAGVVVGGARGRRKVTPRTEELATRPSGTPDDDDEEDAESAADKQPLDDAKDEGSRRRGSVASRRNRPRVHRFLCIVMRYYGRGDLANWLYTQFPLDAGYNPNVAEFPSLMRPGAAAAAMAVESDQMHQYVTGSTVYNDSQVQAAQGPYSPTEAATAGARGGGGQFLALRSLPAGFGTPLPETLLMSLAMQLTSTLGHLHNRGILHCDIKPENVLIADEIPRQYLESRSERKRKQRAAASAKGANERRAAINSSGKRTGTDEAPRLPPNASRYFLPIIVTDFGVSQVIRKDQDRRMQRRQARRAQRIHSAGTAGTDPSMPTTNGTGDLAPGRGETTDGSGNAVPAGFTLPYVSPEFVASGMQVFSAKSDVWAAGCLLYGLATKQLMSGDIGTSFLFERARRFGDREAFLKAIVGDMLRVGYSAPVAEFIASFLDPDSEKRASASQLVSGLVKISTLRYVPASAVKQDRTPQRRQAAPEPARAAAAVDDDSMAAPELPLREAADTDGTREVVGDQDPYHTPDPHHHQPQQQEARDHSAPQRQSDARPRDLSTPLLEDE